MKIKSKLFKDAKRLTIVIPSSLDKKLESFCAKSGHMKSFVVSRAIETLISEANHEGRINAETFELIPRFDATEGATRWSWKLP